MQFLLCTEKNRVAFTLDNMNSLSTSIEIQVFIAKGWKKQA
jgi:hypothetical protein